MKKVLIIAIVAVFLLGCTEFVPPSDLGSRTAKDIQQKWEELLPKHTGSCFEENPVISEKKYTTGRLSPVFINDSLKMIHFVRYLAGIESPLISPYILNSRAQYGSVLITASTLNHNPEKPVGMSDSFFDIALTGTTKAVLSKGFDNVAASIMYGWMRDDQNGSIESVMHRRWILDPKAGAFGFGYAGSSSVIVMEKTNVPAIDYEFVSWPSPGAFPREFFNADDPWHISLNLLYYSKPDDSITVTMTSKKTGKKWKLDTAMSLFNEGSPFLRVNESEYGIGNAIIFRPPVSEIRESDSENIILDVYTIQVDGLQLDYKKGSISYDVSFFDLTQNTTMPLSLSQPSIEASIMRMNYKELSDSN